VEVDGEVARRLMDAITTDPTLELTIDVERGTVSAPAVGIESTFPLDEFTRHRLLEGLDDIGLTLRNADAIATYETQRPPWMPTTGQVLKH
jgi:3-isopropylmalate/(R)-2-methylmalate dehydratase small subunit